MSRFSSQFLDQIRQRLSLPEIVGKRVKLTKRGKDFWGLCPFHSEKSPSFSVAPDKGFYYCFGCGAKGDAFTFLTETENVTFGEAVEQLASKAGINLPDMSPEQRAQIEQKAAVSKDVSACLTAANQYFQAQLHTPQGQTARQYLEQRAFTTNTLHTFQLGYAPDGGNSLRAHLTKENFSEEILLASGLVRQTEGGRSYELFRGRLIFPIFDIRGRVVAFGGRILDQGEAHKNAPKYLNSPETAVFSKSHTLYGLWQARQTHGHKLEDLLVTEGYTDVISLHQAGFTNAVAPLGTALTEEHLYLLWRYVDEPILCFDGDAAGQRAAQRAIDMALPHLQPGKSLRLVHLPVGEDPDSLLQSQGVEAFQSLLNQAEPMAEALFRHEVNSKPLKTPEQIADFQKRLRQRKDSIRENSVAQVYNHFFLQKSRDIINKFSPKFSGKSSGRRQQQKGGKTPGWLANKQAQGQGLLPPTGLQEKYKTGLLAALLYHPHLLEEVAEDLARLVWQGDGLNRLQESLLDLAATGQTLDKQALQTHLQQQGLLTVADSLLQPHLLQLCPFARPDQPEYEALNNWQQAFTSIMTANTNAETAAVGQNIDLTTPEGWASFTKTLQNVGQNEDNSGQTIDDSG